MKTARIFESGNSQAVRLPKEFRFDENTNVWIKRMGDNIVLMPVKPSWKDLELGAEQFTSDFLEDGREQGSDYQRDVF